MTHANTNLTMDNVERIGRIIAELNNSGNFTVYFDNGNFYFETEFTILDTDDLIFAYIPLRIAFPVDGELKDFFIESSKALDTDYLRNEVFYAISQLN